MDFLIKSRGWRSQLWQAFFVVGILGFTQITLSAFGLPVERQLVWNTLALIALARTMRPRNTPNGDADNG